MSPKEPPSLGALEQQVMEVLWDQDPLTIREVIERLPRSPAYTTIATVLGNLERKEMVVRKRDGRSARYLPRRSRGEHAAWVMEFALASSDDRAASMLHFIESIPPGDLELLRSYLDEQDQEPQR